MNGRSPLAVGYARGSRDYITSVDMMDAAPVSGEDTAFRFRFFGIAQSPGEWLPASDAAKDRAKAELRVERDAVGENHFFVCPDDAAPLDRADEYAFRFDPSRYDVTRERLVGRLQGGAGFWAQLIEAIRHAGAIVYPGMTWYVVGISGVPACLNPVVDGSELTLDLRRAFGARNMVPYRTDYGAEGRILTMRRGAER